jgi:hypothetical protein
MLEFGSAEEKLQAMREVKRVAITCTKRTNENAVDDSEEEEEEESIAEPDEDSSDDSELLRPLS